MSRLEEGHPTGAKVAEQLFEASMLRTTATEER